jgi:hypothetical protein
VATPLSAKVDLSEYSWTQAHTARLCETREHISEQDTIVGEFVLGVHRNLDFSMARQGLNARQNLAHHCD